MCVCVKQWGVLLDRVGRWGIVNNFNQDAEPNCTPWFVDMVAERWVV